MAGHLIKHRDNFTVIFIIVNNGTWRPHVDLPHWNGTEMQLSDEYRVKSTLSGWVGGCIQKFPDWPPVARIANGTALCH
jgi:hypothetical protein